MEVKFVGVSCTEELRSTDTLTRSHPVCGCSAIAETPCVNCTGIR